MRDRNTIIICGIICITLLIFGMLFWPTLYRYDKTAIGETTVLIRGNRFTGYTEILNGVKWQKVPTIIEKETQEIPIEAIVKISTRGVFDGKGGYVFAIYNGTEYTIKRIRLSIVADTNRKKKLWQRVYETPIDVPPFSMGTTSITLIDETPLATASWLFNPEDYEPIGPTEKKVTSEKKEPDAEFTGAIRFKPEVGIEKVFGYKGE